MLAERILRYESRGTAIAEEYTAALSSHIGPKNPGRGGKDIAMNLWVRSWTAAGIAVLALMSIPETYAVVQPSGVANADVCASVGRRISVSGCTNVADTVNTYVPPPADYAPLPQDFPPPPPPPPPVSVCVGAGRRIHVSGCS
jgi:hypothetical protein